MQDFAPFFVSAYVVLDGLPTPSYFPLLSTYLPDYATEQQFRNTNKEPALPLMAYTASHELIIFKTFSGY